MYEFHGWFTVAESTEEADTGTLDDGVAGLRARVSEIDWATAGAELVVYNGMYVLLVNGLINRRRDEAAELEQLLADVASRFPGSSGILYERSDDMESPPGTNAFRVRVMARGVIVTRLDPFLSPCRPTIED